MAPDFVTGFYFSLSLQGASGKADSAFQEVTGLSKEMQIEEVDCGGENRFKYRLPSGTKYQNLVLKRGVVPQTSPLLTWCRDTLNKGLATALKPRDVQVKLLNPNGESCMTWNFVSAYPVKWSASDLNAQKNEILIETIELAYRYFQEQ